MFDLALFLVVAGFAILAAAVGVPSQVRVILALRSDASSLPSHSTLLVGAFVQQVVLIAILVALGTWLAPAVDIRAPWFEALARRNPGLREAGAQLWPALWVAGVSSVAFLTLYYRVFRPRMDPDAVQRSEVLRLRLGLAGRIAVGGIIEEAMFRWGLMTVLAWLLIELAGIPYDAGMWAAIVLAGVLFGLGHLPGAAAVGVRITKLVVTMAVVLNLLVAVGFGWLLWHHGLLAAMVAHALVHVFWYPLDRRIVVDTDG